MGAKAKTPTIHRTFQPRRRVVLHNGDCYDILSSLPDDSVALTITSPPYCMGKEYEAETSADDFLRFHKRLLPEIMRVTRPGGSVCWQVGYHVDEGVVEPLDFFVHSVMQFQPDAVLRNRIVWSFGHGLHCNRRFSGRHETVMWYTKGDDYHFDLDAVRVAQKYPGKTHYKGPRRGLPSGNPKGKNPSNVWEIPVVNANHPEKTDHPCQFPVALAQRLVLALSRSGDWVLDPFMGSGSSAVAAVSEGRRFVGAELRSDYYAIATERARVALRGDRRFRPHDAVVTLPNPHSKVARAPNWGANGNAKEE